MLQNSLHHSVIYGVEGSTQIANGQVVEKMMLKNMKVKNQEIQKETGIIRYLNVHNTVTIGRLYYWCIFEADIHIQALHLAVPGKGHDLGSGVQLSHSVLSCHIRICEATLLL